MINEKLNFQHLCPLITLISTHPVQIYSLQIYASLELVLITCTSCVRKAVDRLLSALRTSGDFTRRPEIRETTGTVDSPATHALLGVPRHTRTDKTNKKVGNRVDKMAVVSLEIVRGHFFSRFIYILRLNVLTSAHYTCAFLQKRGWG